VFRARGPLFARQQLANKVGCSAYCEAHFNAHTNKAVNYAMAIVDHAASGASKAWAREYTALCSRAFGHADRGVVIGPGRGSYNVRFAKCPAILVEPGFVSNAEFAAIVQTGEGIDAVARCLVDSIRACFPDGGLVGLSVGHMYRGKPDPGAPVNQGELVDPATDSEAELNDLVITAAEEMLLESEAPVMPAPAPGGGT
jgi:hypothetical protein